jgi:exonuclease SbcD
MKILHTSDWHLGRIFHGIHLTEDQSILLDQFIKLVGDVMPDIILIAGDIFDRSVPPVEAVNLLDETVSKILMDYNIPILMIAGNHDSPDRLGFGYRLLQDRGLIIVSKVDECSKPLVLEDKYGKVYFHSIPYAEPALVREKLGNGDIHNHDESMSTLLQNIRSNMNQGERNVLIAHAFVSGGSESESERPLSVGGSGMVNPLHFKDFDYVALGHLHRGQNIGGDNICYSGSLMKYSFAEVNHKKNISLVELGEKGSLRIEGIELKPRRDLRCIEGSINDIMKGPNDDECREDYIKVVLTDEGAILDAMGKIRRVYPNALHIERPKMTYNDSNLVKAQGDYKKMTEFELFRSFIQQVTDKEMNEEHSKVFKDVLNSYYETCRGE